MCNYFYRAIAINALARNALGEGLPHIQDPSLLEQFTSVHLWKFLVCCVDSVTDTTVLFDNSRTLCKDGSSRCVMQAASRRQLVCNYNLKVSISIHVFSLLLVLPPPPSLPWIMTQSQSTENLDLLFSCVNYRNTKMCSVTSLRHKLRNKYNKNLITTI
jgi:hypothetical protein